MNRREIIGTIGALAITGCTTRSSNTNSTTTDGTETFKPAPNTPGESSGSSNPSLTPLDLINLPREEDGDYALKLVEIVDDENGNVEGFGVENIAYDTYELNDVKIKDVRSHSDEHLSAGERTLIRPGDYGTYVDLDEIGEITFNVSVMAWDGDYGCCK